MTVPVSGIYLGKVECVNLYTEWVQKILRGWKTFWGQYTKILLYKMYCIILYLDIYIHKG